MALKFHGILPSVAVGSAADGGQHLIQYAAFPVQQGAEDQAATFAFLKGDAPGGAEKAVRQGDDAVAGKAQNTDGRRGWASGHGGNRFGHIGSFPPGEG